MSFKALHDWECRWCGKTGQNHSPNKKFCSGSCRRRWYRWMIEHRRIVADAYRICPVCGGGFPAIRQLATTGIPIFCSASCGNIGKGRHGRPREQWTGQQRLYKPSGESVTNSTRDFRSVQAVQCSHIDTDERQCVNYSACLDQELVKKGSGFIHGCNRYTAPQPPKYSTLGGSFGVATEHI